MKPSIKRPFWVLLILAVFGASFFSAERAEGGIFSLVADFLLKSSQTIEEGAKKHVNSQNMALLGASVGLSDDWSGTGGPDNLMIDGQAFMPSVGPMGTLADLEGGVPPSDAISVYTVREGDSLSEIADMYGVSVNTIRWANDLTRNSVIKEGDILVILPVTGVRYTVKKGDTLAGIAKKYGGDADEIVSYNGLDSAKGLVAGQVIIIPDGDMGSPTPGVSVPGTAPSPRPYSGPSYAGYFQAPLARYVKTQGMHGNNAVDLAAPYGSPVYAAAEGRVIVARGSGYNGGYGLYAVISHPNGTQTLYSHESSLTVATGQYVNKGDVIGYVGSTGRSTGNHLHFEVRGAANPF